ncbi:DUF1854 domain-containing protein [Limnobacter humi]|uniref:DUF1854 domain-containing protein n=1 Tax=Limnobacter humi TaxID=1778671 RepID=A0ABT1WED2_9BURK|nr:DUF1854 domain-containing protein [Limnobacter humi]MCQ8895877.1 DUF1854 domain-containing protein [Limnobacter humi]
MNKCYPYAQPRVVESDDGMLALLDGEQVVAKPIHPVLAFPFSNPRNDISLVDEYSKELLWLDSLDDLDAQSRCVVEAHLARREYRPVIHKITSVNTYSTPSVWNLDTDRGPCKFELPSEESIRRLGGQRLVLTHANGMQFIIENMAELDARSRQILARFMA